MNNKITTSFQIATGIKRLILDMFGAITCQPNTELDLDKFVEDIKNMDGMDEFDIYSLTNDEMILLGFGTIKDKDYHTIPAWLFQFLPDEIHVVPEGESKYKLMNKNDMDRSLIFGCLKYGIYPSDFDRRSKIIE